MKIFLSVPFSSRVDTNGLVLMDYRTNIEKILEALRSKGHEVFCALEYTNWDINQPTSPEDEFKKDLEEIDLSDLMIVFLEERVSAGVQLEMGYAYARNIQLEIFQQGKMQWSNNAFSKLSGNKFTQVENIEELENIISTSGNY